MPVQTCQEDGDPGYRWGSQGKCYTYTSGNEAGRKRAKEKAIRQGLAIEPAAFKSGPSALEISSKNLQRAYRLYALVEEIRRARLPIASRTRRAYRARLRLERRWSESAADMLDNLDKKLKVDAATQRAIRDWKGASRRIWKADEQPVDLKAIRAVLTRGVPEVEWVEAGTKIYLGLALAISEESGQFGLDALGLNETFAWAHPRNMARDLFEVRGSKVIQNTYGSHVDELSKIIIDATDPRTPRTLDAVKGEIKDRWGQLTSYQIDRIARTETAAVWTSTSMNAYRANGITRFESLLAHGPTIGIESADPCPICIEAASQESFPIGGDLPPWHPNCRCEAVPILEDENGEPWLPPDEPWTGAQVDGLEPVIDI